MPIKPLRLAKSRLLGSGGRTDEHAELVAAVACDTVPVSYTHLTLPTKLAV